MCPHRLVFRLMELGEDAVRSRRRNVTVMFSDIVEFTPQAEDLPEQQTADLLNHHFALLGACHRPRARRDRQVLSATR
jgi:class 3 adenylate cyclase